MDTTLPTTPPVQLGAGYYWQDLQPGQRFITYRRTITEADLGGFINCTGKLAASFIEGTFSEGAISGRPVPGALTYALIEGLLLQTMIQGTGLAMLRLEQDIHGPVLVNDTVHAVVTVEDIRPTSAKGRAVVKSRIEVINQRGDKVMTYVATRLLAGRPTP